LALGTEDKSKAKNLSLSISCQQEQLWEDKDASSCSPKHARDLRTNFAYLMYARSLKTEGEFNGKKK